MKQRERSRYQNVAVRPRIRNTQRILNENVKKSHRMLCLHSLQEFSVAEHLGAHRSSNNSVVFREAPRANEPRQFSFLTDRCCRNGCMGKEREATKNSRPKRRDGPERPAVKRFIHFSASLADTHFKLSFRTEGT